MTDQSFEKETYVVDNAQEQGPTADELVTAIQLPEAGGIAFCELWGTSEDESGVHDVKITVTHRGFTSLEALEGILRTMATAQAKYGLKPYKVLQSAPKPEQVDNGAQTPQQSNEPPKAQAKQAEPTYEPVDDGAGVLIVERMDVQPRPDQKTRLDFYQSGLQYPVISAVMTPEQLVMMLLATDAWSPELFMRPGSYKVHYKIQWRNSTRMNQNGKPYKNIVSVAKA
jgi:hypothetical protein